MEDVLDAIRISQVYETVPEGDERQPRFLNAALVGHTRHTPRQLLSALQELERRLGRKRGGRRYEPRVLDLDLLLYDREIIRTAELSVPHPRLTERAFVLVPLSDVAPDWRLPAGAVEGGRTVGELAREVGMAGVDETDLTLQGSIR